MDEYDISDVDSCILQGLKFLEGMDLGLTPAEKIQFALEYAKLAISSSARPGKYINAMQQLDHYKRPESLDTIIDNLERQAAAEENMYIRKDVLGKNNPGKVPF